MRGQPGIKCSPFTLRAVLPAEQRLPSTAQYRTTVEQWFTNIHDTCQKSSSIKEIEDELELGQIEEVIENAKDELELIDYYYENKMWELVDEAKEEGNKIAEQMADSIYFFSPQSRGVPPALPQEEKPKA